MNAAPATLSGLMLTILAYDPTDRSLGIALASSAVATGSRCPYLAVGKAVVASQGFTNFKVGPLAVDLVECGLTGEEVMDALRQHDRWMDYRQIAIVSADGTVVAHTGERTTAWAGQSTGPGLACLGNDLPDAAALVAMHAAYVSLPGIDLAERLLRALEAARAVVAGRCAILSASLLVRAPGDAPPVDLRVDLARDPPEQGGCAVGDLRQLYARYRSFAAVLERRSAAPQPD